MDRPGLDLPRARQPRRHNHLDGPRHPDPVRHSRRRPQHHGRPRAPVPLQAALLDLLRAVPGHRLGLPRPPGLHPAHLRPLRDLPAPHGRQRLGNHPRRPGHRLRRHPPGLVGLHPAHPKHHRARREHPLHQHGRTGLHPLRQGQPDRQDHPRPPALRQDLDLQRLLLRVLQQDGHGPPAAQRLLRTRPAPPPVQQPIRGVHHVRPHAMRRLLPKHLSPLHRQPAPHALRRGHRGQPGPTPQPAGTVR